jgi:hypothetical protein
MLKAITNHSQALALAVMLKRSHSTIKFACNGSFDLEATHLFADIVHYSVDIDSSIL